MSIKVKLNQLKQGFKLNVDIEIPAIGVTAIFGPSGSGKTTLLRAIAGLDQIPDGQVLFNHSLWQSGSEFLPVHRRKIGFVFQQPGLFPHLTVQGNLDFALKRSGQPSANLNEIIDLLDIQHLLSRDCDKLSGGEAQRVAIVRALASDPHIMLMDEPLSSLDQKLKNEFLPYLERLHRTLSIPVIYVSHSQHEVTRISDYVFLINRGEISAQGKTNEIFSLLDTPLSQNEQAVSIFDGEAIEHDHELHLMRVRTALGDLWVTSGQDHIQSAEIRLRIAARDVSITLDKPVRTSILNVLKARVENISKPEGGVVTLRLLINDTALLSRVTCKSVNNLSVTRGMELYAQVKSIAVLN